VDLTRKEEFRIKYSLNERNAASRPRLLVDMSQARRYTAHAVYLLSRITDIFMTNAYRLRDDVYSCHSDSCIVFLDLRRDKYLCLNRQNTQLIAHVFADSCLSSTELTTRSPMDGGTTSVRVVQALIEKGLVVEDATEWRSQAWSSIPLSTPTASLLTEKANPGKIRISHRAAFLRASFRASWALRRHSMHRAVHDVRRRKERTTNESNPNRNSLHHLASVFLSLRPWYGREYRCLFDSLALVEFLSSFRFFPQWVFGVKAVPFGAHCWIQDGDCVLNDSLEYVRRFTPIMVV
jgi:hypothetical protein